MQNTLNSYDTMLDLYKQKLAVKKVSPCGQYALFKYTNRVMYDYLWKSNPALLECRGHVYDMETKKIVQAAPRKSFNYLEESYWSDVPLDTQVVLYKKFNGFMACMTRTKDGEVLITTTGSFDSDYVKMADDVLTAGKHKEFSVQGVTHLFEIIHPDDPHIVDEVHGAKLLGLRYASNGDYFPIEHYKEPRIYCSLAEALKIVQHCNHEGYMMYKMQYTGASEDSTIPYWNYNIQNVCKLKSPYYVQKKKLMRAHHLNVKSMFNETKSYCVRNDFDVEFTCIISSITSTFTEQEWQSKSDQERRQFIEEVMKG